MISLDHNDLSEQAVRLMRMVVKYVPDTIDVEYVDEYRKRVFPILIDFLHQDVPCGLKASALLFEEFFENSPLAQKKTMLNPNTITTVALDIVKSLQFDRYDPARPSIAPDISEISRELQKCLDAFTNQQEYTPKNLACGALSVEADLHNSKIFKEQFALLKQENKVYRSMDKAVQEIKHVIERVFEFQVMFHPQSDFGVAVHKHRERDKKTPEDNTHLRAQV